MPSGYAIRCQNCSEQVRVDATQDTVVCPKCGTENPISRSLRAVSLTDAEIAEADEPGPPSLVSTLTPLVLALVAHLVVRPLTTDTTLLWGTTVAAGIIGLFVGPLIGRAKAPSGESEPRPTSIRCPSCGGPNAAAGKCRHCGEEFDEEGHRVRPLPGEEEDEVDRHRRRRQAIAKVYRMGVPGPTPGDPAHTWKAALSKIGDGPADIGEGYALVRWLNVYWAGPYELQHLTTSPSHVCATTTAEDFPVAVDVNPSSEQNQDARIRILAATDGTAKVEPKRLTQALRPLGFEVEVSPAGVVAAADAETVRKLSDDPDRGPALEQALVSMAKLVKEAGAEPGHPLPPVI